MSELPGSRKFSVGIFIPIYILAVAIIFLPEIFAHLNLLSSHIILRFLIKITYIAQYSL